MDLGLIIKQKIHEIVLTEFGLDEQDFIVEHPQNESFGDYATNIALVLSKKIKQSPMDIAKQLSYKLKEDKALLNATDRVTDIFESIDVASPGFINLRISSGWLLKLLTQNFGSGNNYGVIKNDVVKRIALEHSNVNPNKAAHIGHLRNACIGQFIERIYEMQGFAVEVQYYANNVGVQVATSMMGIERLTQYSPTSYKKYDHFAWDVYAEMEAKIAADEKLQEERLNILKKLEDSKSPESIKQRKVATQILVEQLHTFAELGFDYDVIIFESDILAKKLWEAAFTKLKTNPNVYLADSGPSKGCWLVRLGDDSGLTNNDKDTDDQIETDKIIVRSNGVATYTGKDIAYHMWKYGLLGIDFDYAKWDVDTQQKDLWITATDSTNPTNVTFSEVDKVINVIGVEQTYAIDVVKQALDFLGYHDNAQNMKHINYGFVFLSRNTAGQLGIDVSDGKKFYAMSGRKGWGIKIDDLIDAVDARLAQEHGEFSELKKVRTGAIKFSMLKLNTFQDLIFDLEESLDIKGYSGPYLQYACVRANSVLKKGGVLDVKMPKLIDYVFEPKERALIRQLIKFPEIINKSAEAFAPNLLCEYLFETAKRFNTFYNDLSILNAENKTTKEFRLYLCHAVADVMKQGLWLLGIDAPERM